MAVRTTRAEAAAAAQGPCWSTQLLVVVDSDLPVPDTLTEVEIRATVTGRVEVTSRFDVTSAPGSECSATACPLPLSVGVVPET